MSREPLPGNPYATDNATYTEKDSAIVSALLAIAYEIRRASAAANSKRDLFPPGTIHEDRGNVCGAEFFDAFNFVSECGLPAGHAGDHSEAQS